MRLLPGAPCSCDGAAKSFNVYRAWVSWEHSRSYDFPSIKSDIRQDSCICALWNKSSNHLCWYVTFALITGLHLKPAVQVSALGQRSRDSTVVCLTKPPNLFPRSQRNDHP